MQKIINSNYYRQRTALKSLLIERIRDSKLLPLEAQKLNQINKTSKVKIGSDCMSWHQQAYLAFKV